MTSFLGGVYSTFSDKVSIYGFNGSSSVVFSWVAMVGFITLLVAMFESIASAVSETSSATTSAFLFYFTLSPSAT